MKNSMFNNIPVNAFCAFAFGFGLLAFFWSLVVLYSRDSEKRKSTIELFSSLMIVVGTFALVWVTYQHIKEAQNMRKTTEEMVSETKRLADISVEQFKVVSYPTITITERDYILESDKIIQKFELTNKGEMTAFDFGMIIVNTFKIQNNSHGLRFEALLGAFYELGKDKITSVDYEINFPKQIKRMIVNEKQLKPPRQVEHPVHALLIIRFRVPYDTYQYEIFSFVLKEEKEWQRMNEENTSDLFERYCWVVQNDQALNFLKYNDKCIIPKFLSGWTRLKQIPRWIRDPG